MRIEFVKAGEVADLAAELLTHERLSVAGIGPNEERFAGAVERVNPASPKGDLMRVALSALGKVGMISSRPSRKPVTRSSSAGRPGPAGCDAAIDFTRPDAVSPTSRHVSKRRGPCRDRDHGVRLEAVDAGCEEAGVPCSTRPTSHAARC